MSFEVMPERRRCAASSALGVWRCDPPPGASAPPWPTIVFLHGINETGNGTAAALQKIARGAGLPREIEQADNAPLQDPSRFPFLVVAPQTPSRWEHTLHDVEAAVVGVIQSGLVRGRPLLTGFSIGGDGVWAVAARYPSMFAAIVPIASEDPPDAESAARALANVPIWIGYRSDDEHASRTRPKAVIDALAKARNADVEIRRYAGAAPHGWSRHAYVAHQAYTDRRLYRWLRDRAA
jgi:predicted peptidase